MVHYRLQYICAPLYTLLIFRLLNTFTYMCINRWIYGNHINYAGRRDIGLGWQLNVLFTNTVVFCGLKIYKCRHFEYIDIRGKTNGGHGRVDTSTLLPAQEGHNIIGNHSAVKRVINSSSLHFMSNWIDTVRWQTVMVENMPTHTNLWMYERMYFISSIFGRFWKKTQVTTCKYRI